MIVFNITASDLLYDNRQRMAPVRISGRIVTWLMSEATDEWVKGRWGDVRGVTVQQSVTTEK